MITLRDIENPGFVSEYGSLKAMDASEPDLVSLSRVTVKLQDCMSSMLEEFKALDPKKRKAKPGFLAKLVGEAQKQIVRSELALHRLSNLDEACESIRQDMLSKMQLLDNAADTSQSQVEYLATHIKEGEAFLKQHWNDQCPNQQRFKQRIDNLKLIEMSKSMEIQQLKLTLNNAKDLYVRYQSLKDTSLPIVLRALKNHEAADSYSAAYSSTLKQLNAN